MNDEEVKELKEDSKHLCMEIGRFLNKWEKHLFKPLKMALEMLEVWLGGED